MIGERRPPLFSPSRWSVRWRLAGVSAVLTFAILLAFAFVVGRLAEERLQEDFRAELETTATELSVAVKVNCYPLEGLTVGECDYDAPLQAMSLPSGGAVRIVDVNGRAIEETRDAPELGPPHSEVTRIGEYEVATRPLSSNALAAPPAFVQFARDHEELDATISRLWLFLVIGVAAGTMMAGLAGLAVANRAMRPIAALTQTAREIASTRDPSRTMPIPSADDEVTELARTLDAMLGELDAARSESQQMVQAQREFVADASHELRTPLTSILANLELLEDRLDGGDPEAGEMVGSALRSSRRMRLLVADLLLLARADTGHTSGRGECDIAAIVRDAATEVMPVAGEHEIEVRTPASLAVRGNAEELHRLAVNLLDNGIRHTAPNTRITAVVERRGRDAVFEVADDGPGLPPGMEEQVFSRFVRGSGPADLARDAGTGLGLAIVRAVVSSHGGEVTAGSSAHGGARFVVRLPAESGEFEASPKKVPRVV